MEGVFLFRGSVVDGSSRLRRATCGEEGVGFLVGVETRDGFSDEKRRHK